MGSLFVISAPSGAGKTSLVSALCERLSAIEVSVSHTTRPQRAAEEHQRAYHFVTQEAFDALADAGEFLEHAKVFDYAYGTSRSWVQQRLDTGIDVILEIDWQGAAQVRASYPEAVSIFVVPPSLHVLEERLTKRGQDAAEVIAKRLAKAQAEISHYQDFGYLVVNDDFDEALQRLCHIVEAERLRMTRQCGLQQELLENLLKT